MQWHTGDTEKSVDEWWPPMKCIVFYALDTHGQSEECVSSALTQKRIFWVNQSHDDLGCKP